MIDPTGIALRMREKKVLSALRRVVPGEYKSIEEVGHPLLFDAGFDFTGGCVRENTNNPLLDLFLGDNVPEKREPVLSVVRAQGAWTLILDTAGSSGLWLMTCMDYPDRFVKRLPAGCPGAVFMKSMREGWLVGVQAVILKNIIKHGTRD